MKSKEWKRLITKKPKFRVTPFKQTKEEKEQAKLMEKFMDYKWEQVEPIYRQFWKDIMFYKDPNEGKIKTFWDKDKAE